MVENSILNTIKPMVNVEINDTNFDAVLIPFINSAISILTQLGVGPISGFQIKDENSTWDELLGERKDLEVIKTNVYSRVRLWFDPPLNSFLVTALKEEIKETDWRIEAWHDPIMIQEVTLEVPDDEC